MSFVKYLKRAENHRDNVIELLRKKSNPLVLYGAGVFANRLTEYLEKQCKLTVTGYLVDDNYFVPNSYLNGKPIYNIDTLRTQIGLVNILIAFNNYPKACKIIKDQSLQNISEMVLYTEYDLIDINYILENEEKFQETYDMLSDKRSKEIFVAYLNSKIQGTPENITPYYDENQYFDIVTNLNNEEVFLDCGAYNGDTIKEFDNQINHKYKKIYAF